MSFSAIYSFIHTMVQNNMGVAAKMKEYGGMRAIGMSNRQLVKMIIAGVTMTVSIIKLVIQHRGQVKRKNV